MSLTSGNLKVLLDGGGRHPVVYHGTQALLVVHIRRVAAIDHLEDREPRLVLKYVWTECLK